MPIGSLDHPNTLQVRNEIAALICFGLAHRKHFMRFLKSAAVIVGAYFSR